MNRLSRINVIWRKELVDTLRDRRTLVAMVLVPMVLYPALMLGSIQALEVQVSSLVTERYDVLVPDEETARWLRRLIDSDPARRAPDAQATAEELVAENPAASQPTTQVGETPSRRGATSTARGGAHDRPPEYRIFVCNVPPEAPSAAQAVFDAVAAGQAHVGIIVNGPLPTPDSPGSTHVVIAYDESEIRSDIASSGVLGVLERAGRYMLDRRLAERSLDVTFIQPIAIEPRNIATAERMAGSTLGQIVPLILIMMTITGAIYPAIDLTAGERERGTLETLMAAPVPTSDLIAGKFVVVTFIGMLSAILNLISIGGTIYLGGLGSILTQGRTMVFPISALPWVLLMLLPLAVMFSAILLAVCSFARSFKEAQNYIVPVMMAAMIPGVVGILPGTRLEGPIVIMPVANITVLTRELFLGKFDFGAIVWVVLSTTMYAGAAVAVAAKLFGQEAVLFVDSGSVKTLFMRKHFRERAVASSATALLVLTLCYSLNFYIQNSLGQALVGPDGRPGAAFLAGSALTIALLLGVGPLVTALYLRIRPMSAFSLALPSGWGILAGVLLGASTWILARAWSTVQQHWFPIDPNILKAIEEQFSFLSQVPLPLAIVCLAITPALCEELFFRGFVLSGLRSGMGKAAAVIIVSIAFGLFHYTAHKMVTTTALGLLLGLLAVQYRSVWPGVIAHFMHNGITVAGDRADGLGKLLEWGGFTGNDPAPGLWTAAAGAVALAGVLLCLLTPSSQRAAAGTYPPLASESF